ncbi:MAG TPA: M48 family metallopeptidase [Nitrospiria bacterium]|nr:M48 family metallopeptidase [Nitrospiria bacterium]
MTAIDRWWVVVASILAMLLTACQTVPLTGRHQLIIVSEEEELGLGAAAYKKTLTSSKLSTDTATTAMVRRVGERIAKAADRPDYKWEFNLVEDKTPNAFCLPGGKVVVYTGILPFTKDETGLAVVMGHEVAHALARHGAERMSTGELAGIAGKTAAIIFGGGNPESEKQVEQAFGIGSNVGVLLPFSRHQESEADEIGLMLMAKAGYDPRQAVDFWTRMAQGQNGAPPEFLSTHPSDQTRIKRIEGWIPEALKSYQPR